MSDTIAVPNYSLANLVPGIFFSINPANANTGTAQQRTLIIGQKRPGAGNYASNIPVQTTGVNDVVVGAGGPNAMLARMVARYRRSDPQGNVWALPLPDDPAATATVVTLTVTGPATAAGAISLMIAGEEIQVPVNVGDSASVIAANISALVNQVVDMPATGTVTAGVVTLTADNAGAAAGDLDVRQNYYGAAGGEQTPAGVMIAIATTVQGATNPSAALTTALANLGDQPFDFIVMPYTDTASLNLITAMLNTITGRWSWQQQIYGAAFTAIRGTVAARGTFAAARDDAFISCMGYFDSPTPAYEWAADYAGASAFSLRADPALPLGGVGDGVNLTVLPPPTQSQDIFAQQSILLAEGMSTYLVEQGGQVRVQRAVNLYTTNPAGQPDNSYRDVETNYTLMAAIRDLLISLSSQFGRKKLVADGTVISGGSNMVTAQTVLAAIVARYRLQCSLGLCQNADIFAKAAQASNAGNGTVTCYLPLEVANQLRVIAGSVSFSKP